MWGGVGGCWGVGEWGREMEWQEDVGLVTSCFCVAGCLANEVLGAAAKVRTWINPFTAPACKTFGLKSAHVHARENSVFDGPVTNLLQYYAF